MRGALEALDGAAFSAAVAQMRTQLEALFTADFPAAPPQPWFSQLPRYLKAMARRAIRNEHQCRAR